VRKRRYDDSRLAARAARAAGSLGLRIWAKAACRPVDSFAILGAVAASLIIVVNAVFLQSGSHPAPFFANPQPRSATGESRSRVAESTPPTHSADATRAPQPPPYPPPLAGEGREGVRRNDPIAELIGPSSRIMAVQRALSDYGYGQIKQSGILDAATSAVIEKFEREHKLPVTGQVSDRLVSDLAAMIGHSLQ
jgi:hypothetical protein